MIGCEGNGNADHGSDHKALIRRSRTRSEASCQGGSASASAPDAGAGTAAMRLAPGAIRPAAYRCLPAYRKMPVRFRLYPGLALPYAICAVICITEPDLRTGSASHVHLTLTAALKAAGRARRYDFLGNLYLLGRYRSVSVHSAVADSAELARHGIFRSAHRPECASRPASYGQVAHARQRSATALLAPECFSRAEARRCAIAGF